MIEKWKITTESGAIYYVYSDRKVTGGSKDLKDGRLMHPAVIGEGLVIYTPERAHLNPDAVMPGVFSTTVTKIEAVLDDEQHTKSFEEASDVD